MSKTIKTQSGESITVDDDVYKALHKFRWHLRKCRESVTIVRHEYAEVKKNHNIIMHIVELKEGRTPSMTKGWYTMVNGDYLDCRYENIGTERLSDHLNIICKPSEKIRWQKLSGKVNKSMACIIREKMNDECDKKGVK